MEPNRTSVGANGEAEETKGTPSGSSTEPLETNNSDRRRATGEAFVQFGETTAKDAPPTNVC